MNRGSSSMSESRFTPLNALADACERTCAVLIVYSGDMHPSAITELLGQLPTRVVVAGEASLPNSLGRTRLGKLNAWFLSSEEYVSSRDVRHHLDWLLDRLMQKRETLRALQSKRFIKMYVSCPWWSRQGGGGPSLWPEQMQGLAELNLECSFSFSDYSSESVEILGTTR